MRPDRQSGAGMLLALLAVSCAWGAGIAPATVVRFNTVCANCHEGECSGRLSFRPQAEAAGNHVRRYLDAVSAPEVEALFQLLRYTKEHCRRYPVASNAAADGRWRATELAAWRTSAADGYFIPLGALRPGRLQLRMTRVGDAPCSLRVTDARFEVAVEEQSCSGGATVVTFSARSGEHYLHVQTASEILGLELDQD